MARTEERLLIESRRLELFELVLRHGSPRKCRLLIAECCRALGQEEVAQLSEQVAEGALAAEELQIVRHRPWVIRFLKQPRRYKATRVPPSDQVREFVWQALHGDPKFGVCAVLDLGGEMLRGTFGQLIRDIFGNPFPPIAIEPRWRTATVIDLARTIYDEFPRQAGGYMRMPILADALMDAGCDSEALIGHCREEGPHVRGCWAVDLLLGKS